MSTKDSKFLINTVLHFKNPANLHFNAILGKTILSVSTNVLQLCSSKLSPLVSFKALHKLNDNTIPNRLKLYKHAILIHKLY